MSDFVTYRHIRDALNELSDEQLDMTACIYESDTMEVFDISDTYTVENFPKRHREELLNSAFEDNQPLFVVGFLNQDR